MITIRSINGSNSAWRRNDETSYTIRARLFSGKTLLDATKNDTPWYAQMDINAVAPSAANLTDRPEHLVDGQSQLIWSFGATDYLMYQADGAGKSVPVPLEKLIWTFQVWATMNGAVWTIEQREAFGSSAPVSYSAREPEWTDYTGRHNAASNYIPYTD